MFNARETLNLLVDSPALDTLLAEASKHASAISPENPKTAVETLTAFDKEAEALDSEARAAVAELSKALQAKHAQREVKVATVLRMLEVGSRLVG